MREATRPRIALTGPTRNTEAWLANYIARLDEQGAEAIVLRPGDEILLPELVPTLQGLLISGGADIEPSRCGQPRDANTQSEPERDDLEFLLLSEMLKQDLPVLGICRGFQLLNVHFGGALIQDLPGHRDHNGASAQHTINIDAGSRLGQLVRLTEATVNSRHHQGVSTHELVPPLRATALTPDDRLIEAFEHPAYRWVIGVQWHPERTGEVPEAFSALFRDVVAEAKRVPGRVS